MKYGIRKPSMNKRISARTKGRATRAIKKATIPGYGQKGTGWIKDPKRAAYNKVYNKTSRSISTVEAAIFSIIWIIAIILMAVVFFILFVIF